MAKIINFPKNESDQTADEFLQESVQLTLDGDPVGITIAVKCKDGTVMTGYWHVDFGQKAEIIGHLQADMIDQMILNNLERYGG
jgi:hypothetical protein